MLEVIDTVHLDHRDVTDVGGSQAVCPVGSLLTSAMIRGWPFNHREVPACDFAEMVEAPGISNRCTGTKDSNKAKNVDAGIG